MRNCKFLVFLLSIVTSGSHLFGSGSLNYVFNFSLWFLLFFFGLRIHEGRVPYCNWICGDGIRWLLRQAHLHSHQQHNRRFWLGSRGWSLVRETCLW
uniref:Uncharacterized protein n=1 Tax=Rhizophora mucronata TaxID=61149 RepID=A0A2P2J6K4_RHIMU